MNVQIKKLRDTAELPEYQTAGSAAMDLVACMEAPVNIKSLERVVVPTGIAIALPDGYEAQVRSRGSLPAKHGIIVANGVGTVDADYRGEIGVILLNASNETYTVNPGDRVAQLLVAPYTTVSWSEVEVLDETDRGIGAYGSTGY